MAVRVMDVVWLPLPPHCGTVSTPCAFLATQTIARQSVMFLEYSKTETDVTNGLVLVII